MRTLFSAIRPDGPLRNEARLVFRVAGFGRLAAGQQSPFDRGGTLSGELLKKHPDPKDRGNLLQCFAHVYAQSGLFRPRSAIDYAQKAMQCPLTPQQQIRLYGYWGNRLLMLKPTDSLRRGVERQRMVFLDRLATPQFHYAGKGHRKLQNSHAGWYGTRYQTQRKGSRTKRGPALRGGTSNARSFCKSDQLS